jgi:hypothetical protein
VTAVRERTFELVEFLHDILKVDAFPWAQFPYCSFQAAFLLRGAGSEPRDRNNDGGSG